MIIVVFVVVNLPCVVIAAPSRGFSRACACHPSRFQCSYTPAPCQRLPFKFTHTLTALALSSEGGVPRVTERLTTPASQTQLSN